MIIGAFVVLGNAFIDMSSKRTDQFAITMGIGCLSLARTISLRCGNDDSFLRASIYLASAWGRLSERDGHDTAVEREAEICRDAIRHIEERGVGHAHLWHFYAALGHASTRRCERSGLKEDAVHAIDLYEAALALPTVDQSRQEGTLRAGLGTALVRLGEREDGDVQVRRAVDELDRALALCARQENALTWASVSNTLATALTRLGERSGEVGHFLRARDHLMQALEVRRRDSFPHAWSATVTDLGNVLVRLSEVTGDADYVHQALDCFGDALEVVTLEGSPRDYAETKNNLGFTLTRLAGLTGDRLYLTQAVAAFQEAVRGAPRAAAPLDWAVIQVGVARAWFLHGDRESLDRALEAVGLALEVLADDLAPVTYADALELRKRIEASRAGQEFCRGQATASLSRHDGSENVAMA